MRSIEETNILSPKYDKHGLIPAIVQSASDQKVLMMAWMNEDALKQTRATGFIHFWSRSRQKLWRKGEESGAQLKVVEIRVDCDQDCLLVLAIPEKQAGICHTGRDGCFYRVIGAEDDSLTPL